MGFPYPGPIPPYTNPPIEPQFYQPSSFIISNITLGVNTTVTTTENMNYTIGQLVRLIIPPTFGCRQLNEQQGYVISIPSDNQVVLNIYSVGGEPYVASSASTKSQIIAIGDINSGVTNTSGPQATSTIIPGSFINISPA